LWFRTAINQAPEPHEEKSMTFKALLASRDGETISTDLVEFEENDLMLGDVTIAVGYSTVNYKDGFALTGRAPIFRTFPMIPGINATAAWAAKLGMNLQSSTLKFDETGEPFHVQQANQIRAFRAAWKESGYTRIPRVSVSRSIFALVDDRDRAYFGHGEQDGDQFGYIDGPKRAVFGRSYAAEPEVLIEQLRGDEAIAEADTLLLTIPNQLGVAYNVHVLEAILTTVAPALGWR
jgi:alkanesulfonate monooxygenase SsuD/methylene tetrahydromethanopterin reductase-like flavin-dependent oxidoreductase (luciferase family)